MQFLHFFRWQNNRYVRLPTSARPPVSCRWPPRNIILYPLIFAIVLMTANLTAWKILRDKIRQEYRYITPMDKYVKLNAISAVNVADLSNRPNEMVIHLAHNERAVVSSLLSEAYLPAILVLANSLKSVNTSARFILTYFPERISARSRCFAEQAGWELHPVERIAPPDDTPLFWRYADQYTKLRIWTLDTLGIKTAIYLDGDMLVRKNFDELFSLPFNFAAVPDVYTYNAGFSLSVNAGMLLFRPSTAVFEDMVLKMSVSNYMRNEAEQGFLRMYFAYQVVRLPYIYNTNLAIKFRSQELWNAMLDEIRVIHYTTNKPFAENVTGVIDLGENEQLQRKTLAKERSRHRGMFDVEMGWWEKHYNETLQLQKGACENYSHYSV